MNASQFFSISRNKEEEGEWNNNDGQRSELDRKLLFFYSFLSNNINHRSSQTSSEGYQSG